MSDDSDDRWVDVLAGKAEPTGPSTRQAARLREYFERQAAEDLAAPVDAEAEKRMLNTLRARGAFDAEPRGDAPAAGGRFIDRLSRWFGAAGEPRFGRYVAAGAMALAVVIAAPLMLQVWHGSEDDGLKGTKPAGNGTERLVIVAEPEPEASRLVSALARAGVTAAMARQGGDLVVRAEIPADHLAAATRQLMDIGLAPPGTGALVVRFRKSP